MFIEETAFWKCRRQNGDYFVWGSPTVTDGFPHKSWWRHQMETFSALLALCAGNSPVTGEFPAQRPVTRSFEISFICVWINSWINNREAGDLRRYHAHYDVIVMSPVMRTTFACHEVVMYLGPVSLTVFPSQFKFDGNFSLISILIQWSLQNFVHGTTAVLSWHVQKFVAIWWSATELQQGEVFIELELRAKNR